MSQNFFFSQFIQKVSTAIYFSDVAEASYIHSNFQVPQLANLTNSFKALFYKRVSIEKRPASKISLWFRQFWDIIKAKNSYLLYFYGVLSGVTLSVLLSTAL